MQRADAIWETLVGKGGYKVEDPNGNSIFLPVTGFYSKDCTTCSTTEGNYWSSSTNTNHSESAFTFFPHPLRCLNNTPPPCGSHHMPWLYSVNE